MLIKVQVCYWGSYCCLINFLLTGCSFWNIFSAVILLLPQYNFGFKLMHILKIALLCLMILTKLLTPHACLNAKPGVGTDHSVQFCSFSERPLNRFSVKSRFPTSCTKAEFLIRILGTLNIFPGYILIYISKAVMWAISRVYSFSNYIFHLIEVKVSVVWLFHEPLCFKSFIGYSINFLNCFCFSVIFKTCLFKILAMGKKTIKANLITCK